jgi:hypothetical protein
LCPLTKRNEFATQKSFSEIYNIYIYHIYIYTIFIEAIRERIIQNAQKQISWTCKLSYNSQFTQHFDKSQISQFNIEEAGRTTKDTFLNLTNKT